MSFVDKETKNLYKKLIGTTYIPCKLLGMICMKYEALKKPSWHISMSSWNLGKSLVIFVLVLLYFVPPAIQIDLYNVICVSMYCNHIIFIINVLRSCKCSLGKKLCLKQFQKFVMHTYICNAMHSTKAPIIFSLLT